MTINFEEDLQGLSPQERAEQERDWVELIEAEIDMLDRLNPELSAQVASKMKPETLLAGLTPEKIAALTPQQRQKILALLSQSEGHNGEEDHQPEQRPE
jgi:hypothetical protein